MVSALVIAGILAAGATADETPAVTLSPSALPGNMAQVNTEAAPTTKDGRTALRVRFNKVDWPNVYFTPPEGLWDWSASPGLAVDVFNPEEEPVAVSMRVDNAGADGANNCNTGTATAAPGEWTTLRLRLSTGDKATFWGMRGIPGGSGSQDRPIDPAKITAFQVFLPRPAKEHTLLLSNFRTFGPAAKKAALPFVDRFGQYKHADYPGKLVDEKEPAERRIQEEKALRAAPELPGRDRFGGWMGGPKLEATGWFRAEKVGGRWWLVTPEGHVFLSIGADCVNNWEQTFIEKREAWFEWLPDPEGEFKAAYGRYSGAHSMAEAIGGGGRTFNFYKANLIRKYGDGWNDKWRENSYARLRAWGFNTVANWSAADVLEHSPMPFTANASVSGDFRRIEGGGGYWGKMPDVFDPRYAVAADASIAGIRGFAANPLCIGYFVDNEIAWDAVERGPLASPPDQPCRVEMVKRLAAKHGSLEALNEAWGTDASSWEALRVPDRPNEACRRYLEEWVYAFARRYFETISAAVKKHAPNQLYLGCRFAWSHPAAVRACDDVSDVVSFNIYRREVDCLQWSGGLKKPLIIGEFHFGALDRGMLHTGLVATESQADRAAHFKRYVESVADCPAFVGCHWFQYVDEPLTGRVYDGENYNIGLVDVTDTPYPELISAAREVNAEVYERHMKSK
ncbi:MAG: hypothetical protein KBC96_08230 [Armatimonadetes bacterium]|nr:hypothetical protein [Armatimonadota bacterium]